MSHVTRHTSHVTRHTSHVTGRGAAAFRTETDRAIAGDGDDGDDDDDHDKL